MSDARKAASRAKPSAAARWVGEGQEVRAVRRREGGRFGPPSPVMKLYPVRLQGKSGGKMAAV